MTVVTLPTDFAAVFTPRPDEVATSLGVAEQLEDAPVNTYQYKVVFKPSTIIPDINIR